MLKRLLIIALMAMPVCAIAQNTSDMKFATVRLQEIFQLMPETT